MLQDDLVPDLKALADESGHARAGDAGLWLSRDGRWFCDGQAVAHDRLSALLDRSMVRRDGILIVTTGIDVLPFAAEDAPLRVVAVDLDAGQVRFHTGAAEPLPPQLVVDDRGVVRSACVHAAMWARWERRIAHQLVIAVDEHGRLSGCGWHAELIAADPVTDWTAAPRGA